MISLVDYRGGPRCIYCGGLEARPEVASVVDYKEAPGAQCGGLEGRPQVHILVDYRWAPGCQRGGL